MARGAASPVELRTSWTVRDVLDAHEALDWHDWLERDAQRRASRK